METAPGTKDTCTWWQPSGPGQLSLWVISSQPLSLSPPRLHPSTITSSDTNINGNKKTRLSLSQDEPSGMTRPNSIYICAWRQNRFHLCVASCAEQSFFTTNHIVLSSSLAWAPVQPVIPWSLRNGSAQVTSSTEHSVFAVWPLLTNCFCLLVLKVKINCFQWPHWCDNEFQSWVRCYRPQSWNMAKQLISLTARLPCLCLWYCSILPELRV